MNRVERISDALNQGAIYLTGFLTAAMTVIVFFQVILGILILGVLIFAGGILLALKSGACIRFTVIITGVSAAYIGALLVYIFNRKLKGSFVENSTGVFILVYYLLFNIEWVILYKKVMGALL